MKILIVGQYIEPPFAEGITNVILNWSRALSNKSLNVQVLSSSSNFSGHHKILGVNFEFVKTNSARFQRTPTSILDLQRAVIKCAKNFDIIHYAFNADGISYLPNLSLLKVQGSKTINSYHGGHLISAKFRNILFDGFTVPSKRMFNLFKQKIPPQRIRVIPPCVNTEFFKPRDKHRAREKLGFTMDEFLIFTVGHFKRGRRLEPLIGKVEELTKKRKNVRLLIGWTGYDKVDDIEKASMLFKKKKFVQIIPPTDLINLYYNAIDIYVMSAKSDYVIEMPMSIIEALSSGVPTITFNINAASEIIKNRYNGYLIEDGNFDNMKTKLSNLIEEELLLAKLGENARRSILQYFSYKTVGNQLESLYSEMSKK